LEAGKGIGVISFLAKKKESVIDIQIILTGS
jgi:hypothetical protein